MSQHDLAPYRQLRKRLGSFDPWKIDSGYYAGSLNHAYGLAKAIGDPKLATEALVHIVQLGNYKQAYKIAEANRDDRALITIGFLTLVDFYEGPHRFFYNTLLDAIEAFKRVQGPLKDEANQIMFDLAMEVTGDRFLHQINSENHQTYLEHGLRLLRSTGYFVRSVPIDSVRVDFITEVRDPLVIKAIRQLIPRIKNQKNNDVLEALAAIRDVDGLNKRAESVFRERFNASQGRAEWKYMGALRYYEIAENIQGVKKVLDAIFTEDITEFPDFTISVDIVPAVLEAYGIPGLQKVFALLDKQIAQSTQPDIVSRFEALKEKLQMAIQINNFSEFRSFFSRRPAPYLPVASISKGAQNLIRKQEYLRKELNEAGQKATPERIAEYKKKAAGLLASGDAWAAYLASIEALDAEGLIAAGDWMVKRGNGLNAMNPYLAAAVLQQMR